jgi:MFS family permease
MVSKTFVCIYLVVIYRLLTLLLNYVGYSVELGQMEPLERRGQILATGQRVRFTFCVLAGIIQTFLLNGPATGPSNCISSGGVNGCWSWGLSINQYYGLIFALIAILFLPVCFLKEPDATEKQTHSITTLLKDLWLTMQNLTTMRLVIFVVGYNLCASMVNNVNIFLQYYVIQLSNFQAGIDTITTYIALVAAIYLFQTFLLNRNWRITQYLSTIVTSILGNHINFNALYNTSHITSYKPSILH